MVLADDDDLNRVGGNGNGDDALATMLFHIFVQLFLSCYGCVCGRIFCVNLFLLCRGSARTRRLAAAKLCWNKSKLLIPPPAIVMLDHDHPSPIVMFHHDNDHDERVWNLEICKFYKVKKFLRNVLASAFLSMLQLPQSRLGNQPPI